jgi:hypothetical protein
VEIDANRNVSLAKSVRETDENTLLIRDAAVEAIVDDEVINVVFVSIDASVEWPTATWSPPTS